METYRLHSLSPSLLWLERGSVGTEVGGPIAAGVGAAGLRSHSEDRRALEGQSEGPRVRRLVNGGCDGAGCIHLSSWAQGELRPHEDGSWASLRRRGRQRPQTPSQGSWTKVGIEAGSAPGVCQTPRGAQSSRPGLCPTKNTGHLPPTVSKVVAFSPDPQDPGWGSFLCLWCGGRALTTQTQCSLSAAV